jgi:cytochrome c553
MSGGDVRSATTTIEAGQRDDLRPLYANAADVAEGKRVAETTCASCHGVNGISTTEGVPHIAGQRPAYLWIELRAYKTGARSEKTMGAAAKSILSDEALLKVAAYYASLDPPQPAASSAKPRPDPLQAGKAASAACAGCHGETGISKTPGTPSLAGLDPKYFATAMKAYKAGQRKNETMKPMAAMLSEADVANVGQFYAVQKPAPGTVQKGADIGAGKTAAAACIGCHGEKGGPANAETPVLAGQDAQYLAVALKSYKDGSRVDETMKGIAASIDDAAARNIAAYYAALQPQVSQRKPLTTAEWAQRCDRCHGTNGNSTDPRLPALAAQRVDYLAKVLDAYRKGERQSKQMAAMSAVLTESDVENLAAYYGRQPARAVLYVVVPPK